MATRRILVLGATGGTGRLVVAQALERGHAVTALVRDPQRLSLASDRLRLVTGDVMRAEHGLDAAVEGQDAVICALGVGRSFTSGGLIATAAPRLVRAMEGRGVRRLVFTSAFGVGITRRDMPLVPRLFQGLLLRDVYRDKTAGEQSVIGSRLDWTIVYPTGLTDAPATGRCRAGERLPLRGFPTIARADLAAFLVAQVEDDAWVRKGVLVSA